MDAATAEVVGISLAALFVAMLARKLGDSRPLLPDLLRELLACDLCTSFWSVVVVVLALAWTDWGAVARRALLIPVCAGATFCLVRWTRKSTKKAQPLI